MDLLVTIININIIVWLFPPIKQYRRPFFYYFLILAISDPLSILLLKSFGIKSFQSFIILSYLLLITIIDIKILKKYFPAFVVLGILVSFFGLFLPETHSTRMLLVILHIILFSLFAKNLVVNSAKYQVINFFYFFLAFYEATLLIKFFVFILRVDTGVVYYYFTSIFQMLFGIYFSLANEEKPLLKINLNPNKPDI